MKKDRAIAQILKDYLAIQANRYSNPTETALFTALSEYAEKALTESRAEKLFDLTFIQNEIEDMLCNLGVEFEKIGWDYYDYSLELLGVHTDHRLTEEAQKAIHDCGFFRVCLNHKDGWETYYHWKEPFEACEGWRKEKIKPKGDADEPPVS